MLTISDIAAIQSAGAKAFMKPDAKCATWAICERISDHALAYIQTNRLAGISVSTIHMANSQCGTGFRVAEDLAAITPEALEAGFAFAPNWASPKKRAAVRKYDGMFSYRSASPFNSEYRELPDAALLAHAAHDLALYAVNERALYDTIRAEFPAIRKDRTQGRYAPGAWLEHAKRAAAAYVKDMGADDHTARFEWPMVLKEAAAQIADHYADEISETA